MSVSMTCPSCKRSGKLPEHFPGGKVKCPACGTLWYEPPRAAQAAPRVAAAKPPVAPLVRPAPAAPPPRPAPPKPAPVPTAFSDLLDDAEPDDAEPLAAPLPVRGTRGVAAQASGSSSGVVYVAVGGGVAVLAAVVVLVLAMSRGGPEVVPPSGGGPSIVRNSAPAPGPSVPSVPAGYPAPGSNPATAPAVASTSATAPTPPPPTDTETIIRKLKDATTYIKLSVNGKLVSTGTGFVIEAQGNRVLLATNRHVAVPDLSDLPDEIAPEGVVPTIEAVFRSGEGPGREQVLPAHLVAADLTYEMSRDLAFLFVEGVNQPPEPIDPLRSVEPTEGMRYTAGGFPLGEIMSRSVGGRGNPSITITRGGVSALRRDDSGSLSAIQVDGSLQPGNSGGPIVDERTGGLLGVAVAKYSAADTIGLVVPAVQLRKALAGRVGGLMLKLNSPPQGTAELEVRAQLVDPKRQIRTVEVQAAPASAVGAFGPNPDGTWPPLPNARPVVLQIDTAKAEATGRLQVQLSGQGDEARKIFIQSTHRDAAGRVVYERPKEVKLPERPGVIRERGEFEQFLKTQRKRSLAKLGALIDPDEDCQLKKDPSEGTITITVPGKKVHTLSPEITVKKNQPLHNAPMTLAEVKGDFAALVKVTGTMNPGSELIKGPRNQEIPITFQGAGLIVYEDKNNFLRLERSTGTAGDPTLVHRLLVEVVRDGKQAMRPYYIDVPEGDMMLILIRSNGRIRCMFSPNMESLISFKEFAFDFPETVKVGLLAANISRKQLEASFEGFVLIDDSAKIDEEFGE
jgi:S1-C subfamily serine protease/regulation of enolase protein 1 (concanavalin A-like superfamily)